MPIVGHGMAFVSTGFSTPEFLAIRLDGARGDITAKNVVWRTKKGAPKMPSPILLEDLLFMLSDQGVVTCLEAQTGKEIWKERIGGDYAASRGDDDGTVDPDRLAVHCYQFANTLASTSFFTDHLILRYGRSHPQP